MTIKPLLADAGVRLDRDRFLRSLLRSLAGNLQDAGGLEVASGYVSAVGQEIGESLNAEYRRALGRERLTREEVADVLVDLKRRIEGGFRVVEASEDKIVLVNSTCPFGQMVTGRPSLCMMTSSVFGSITADNLGYAKVELQETIAEGHAGCRIVVHLRRTPAAKSAAGREYHTPEG